MIELDVLTSSEVAADGQPKQWRSLAHREKAPGLQALAGNEFHPASSTNDEEDEGGTDRRSFIKIMGATMALAGVGLSGCRRPVEKVMPYVRQPEDIIPGVAQYFATAMPLSGVVHPVLVESHEGRPTKIEGNPEHPASLGKSNGFAQASILNLYDPDRARTVRQNGSPSNRAAFAEAARAIHGNAATRIAVISEPTSSPTAARLRSQLESHYASVRWATHSYVPYASNGVRPLYNLSRAQTIVSFDADFLSDPASGVYNSREFADGRRVETPADDMSRLYVIESAMTPTGGMADHRLRMRASDIPHFAAAVAQQLGVASPASGTTPSARAQAFAEAIVEDARAGQTVFIAGPTQPEAVHAMAAHLNGAFAGDAVEYRNTGIAADADESIQDIVSAMNAGEVDVLLMIGVNPVYDTPASLGFADALQRVETSITLTAHRDETAAHTTWVLPRAHYLEAWGDGRSIEGTVSVIQPLIAPLYPDVRSEIEVLNLLANGTTTSGHELVRDTIREAGHISGAFEDGWRRILHDGFIANSAYAPGSAATGEVGDLPQAMAEDSMELVIQHDSRLLDGAFSNNAWMLELPEAVTKLTWDNVAVMSVATADKLGVRFVEGSYEGGVVEAGKIHASLVSITTPDGETATLPVWVQPGHPDNSVLVHLGWGRSLETDRSLQTERGMFDRIFTVDTDHYRFGAIANGIGVRVGHLRSEDNSAVVPGITVSVESGRHMLASTQDHGSMEDRPIVRMATLEEFRNRPTFAQEAVPMVGGVPFEEFPPIWREENTAKGDPRFAEAMYSDHQWGMTIDLNVCSGCNACVVACQSENNVSVVGKDEISRGREMHWLRMDRYYTGDSVEDAGMAVMPMMCQQCEYAPCESVCPVAATVHSPDGLNEMVYNRCIGTRYCSNNCPYKVRRYNWFNWTKRLPIETRMQLNPNVTTRFRGVMEKCTWCVQRIRAANQVAHIEDRKIADGEVQTACQQACPSDAIVFGDLTDPDSRVSRSKRTARRYELLAEYNTRPRLSYLARLSNPNPRLLAFEEGAA